MSEKREGRLKEVLRHVGKNGQVDIEALRASIQRTYGLSPWTSLSYVVDLEMRGFVSNRYGNIAVTAAGRKFAGMEGER